MNGHCPNCGKSDYSPDLRQQGANRCNFCGHVAMVREFHRLPSPPVFARGVKEPQPSPTARLRQYPSPREYTGRELENGIPASEPQPRFWWQET